MNELFKNWFDKQPEDLQNFLRKLIRENCGWSRDVWFNKYWGRTDLTRPEMIMINEIAQEKIFNLELKVA